MAKTRTFLALEIDQPTKDYLRSIVQSLTTVLPSVRFVASGTWHITLAFLGDLEETQLLAAQRAAQVAASGHTRFSWHVEGIDIFGSEEAPHVIWTGLGGDLAALNALQQAVVTALTAEQLTCDERFSPHITLARPKVAFTAVEQVAFAAARAQSVRGPDTFAEAISVMRSDLAPSGARYTRINLAPLA